MTRLRKVLLVLLVLALVKQPLAWLQSIMLPEPAAAPVLNHAVTLLQALLLFALPGWLLLSVQMRILRKSACLPGWGFLPLLLAVLARLTAVPLNRWWMELIDAPAAVMPRPEGGLGVVAVILVVVVVPAVAEELFFRGALLGNLLEGGSRRSAVLLTAMMFALMHGNLAGLPGHLLIGLMLTVLALYSRRLMEPIAAHMDYNLLALIRWETGAVVPWISGALLFGTICWMLRNGPRRTRQMRLAKTEYLLCAVILLVMAAQYLV